MENEKKNIGVYFYVPVAGTKEKKKRIIKKKICAVKEWATAHFNMGIISQYRYCIMTAMGA